MNEPSVPTRCVRPEAGSVSPVILAASLLAGLLVVVLAGLWLGSDFWFGADLPQLAGDRPLAGGDPAMSDTAALTDGRWSWVIALGLYGLIAVPVAQGLPRHHPFRRFGSANRITLARAALICALAGSVAVADEPDWPLWLLAGLAALLDGVDGWVARRTRLSSRFGARFDMEIDALLILVLALLAWRTDRAGPWILAAGAMRYVFVAAAAVWPWLAAPLPPSARRKAVCAVQVVSLLLCLLPGLPPLLAVTSAALGLLALTASFAIDVSWLWRARQ